MSASGLSQEPARTRKPVWHDLSAHFTDESECLAAFIAFETAEVLDGVKPSTLINLPDRPRKCGRNLYRIWKEHGEDVIKESSLEAAVLVERNGSLLLLLYDRAALSRLLTNRGTLTILRRAGYPAMNDIAVLLSEFASRFASGGVPHEIGLILGYPLKDVAGFMGLSRREFSCQGPWKIYGDPGESLMLAEAHRQSRCRMAGRLVSGSRPYECLGLPIRTVARTGRVFLSIK
ncbi:MAG: DUF3793 family protein [Geobacter sp.]|nr:MAG: DUF3793 family protein [Geobacter sp.]